MKTKQAHASEMKGADSVALFRKVSLATTTALLATVAASHGSTEYGPAVWRPTCNANWYTSGYGTKFCVIHDMEGYYASVISWFTSCTMTSASVHYAVNGKQDTASDYPAGEITQMVSENYYAWHAGCWNQWMYGTEHEGFASNPAWYTDAMYNATIGLQKHLAAVGDGSPIPMDRNHIIGHGEKSNANWVNWVRATYPALNATCNTHTDPGPYWDWNRLINGMNAPAGNLWSVAVGRNADGRLQMFAHSPANTVRTKWQTAVNGGWSGWMDMGGNFLGVPCVGTNKDGRLQVFIQNADHSVSTAWQTSPNGAFSGWQNMGGSCYTDPAVGNNADGRLQVFTRSSGNTVWSSWQTTVNGTFSGWGNMGGSCYSVVGVGKNADGRMQIFTRAADNTVWSSWQTTLNGAFSGWTGMGGSCFAAPAVGSNADGRIQVFTQTSGNQVWTMWQTSVNGIFSSWGSMGGSCYSGVGVGYNADGRLQIFTQASGNTVWSAWQTAINGAFSGWNNMGGSCQATPSVGNDADGRMELFTRATDNTVWQAWQTSPNGVFSGWTGIGY